MMPEHQEGFPDPMPDHAPKQERKDAPADLFADLWKLLEGEPEATRTLSLRLEASRNRPAGPPEGRLEALLKRRGDAAVPVLRRWISSAPAAPPRARLRRCLLAAQAVDAWHAPLAAEAHVHRPMHDDLKRARLRLKLTDRLNRGGPDQVVIRRSLWSRWTDLDREPSREGFQTADLFDHLVLIPASLEAGDPDDASLARRVSLRHIQSREADQRPAPAGRWAPVIGVAPLAEREEDLALDRHEEEGRAWYDACARPLPERAAEAVRRLCEAGAHIIVLLEMTLTPDTLEAIRRSTARHGPGSGLSLVIAGTLRRPAGGSKPFNEAVVFDHRGRELMRQRKLHRWNLEVDQCRQYDVRPADGEGDTLDEYMTPGEEVTILEQPGFGRFVVMICEDLGRTVVGEWLRLHMALDWVFTPVLDTSLEDWRWTARFGASAARTGFCRVVVANSLPLTHRLDRMRRLSGQPGIDDCGIGLMIDPANRETPRHLILRVPLPDAGKGLVRSAAWHTEDWDPVPEDEE
jgi:hypothetical protein